MPSLLEKQSILGSCSDSYEAKRLTPRSCDAGSGSESPKKAYPCIEEHFCPARLGELC